MYVLLKWAQDTFLIICVDFPELTVNRKGCPTYSDISLKSICQIPTHEWPPTAPDTLKVWILAPPAWFDWLLCSLSSVKQDCCLMHRFEVRTKWVTCRGFGPEPGTQEHVVNASWCFFFAKSLIPVLGIQICRWPYCVCKSSASAHLGLCIKVKSRV
jgi:hypothetical protein